MPSMLKVALPALAAASTAYAACSASATTTIQNSGDATALATCSTFSGSIAVATGTTDDIRLDGIKKITGNLVVNANENIQRISGSDLETLDGELNLDGLVRLTNVEFPKLKTVDSINWNALPNLNEIGFTAEVEKASKVRIENTALRSLKGINIEEVETIFIANNGYIDEIAMQLGNVSESLDFSNNNENVKIELTNLIWANNLTFRFTGSVSMPSLEVCNGSLGLYNNGFESFSAPNLTEVGEALALVANEKLNNITFPKLEKISGVLQIANNTLLKEVSGFPELTRVEASFDVSGNMSEVSTPKLDFVKGTCNIQSTENVSESCGYYKNLKEKKLIQGKLFCKGQLDDPGMEGHNPTGSNGNQDNAATAGAVNVALGLAAMAAIMLF